MLQKIMSLSNIFHEGTDRYCEKACTKIIKRRNRRVVIESLNFLPVLWILVDDYTCHFVNKKISGYSKTLAIERNMRNAGYIKVNECAYGEKSDTEQVFVRRFSKYPNFTRFQKNFEENW